MSRKGDFTNAQRRQIRDRAAGLCEECGAPGRDADHMHALGLGGGGDLDNAAYLCVRCHASKTAKDKRMMAKADRCNGKTQSQYNGKNRHKGKLRSRGFQGWRRMDGSIVRKT